MTRRRVHRLSLSRATVGTAGTELSPPAIDWRADLLHAIVAGSHPLEAWRERKRGSRRTIRPSRAGISKAYLCQIETAKRAGAMKTMKTLAVALGVPLDELQT